MGKSTGFSLVELLVGVVVMGVVISGIAGLARQQTLQMNEFEAKMSLANLVTEISSIASNPLSCKNLLNGDPEFDPALAEAKDGAPISMKIHGTPVEANSTLANYALKINSLVLKGATDLGLDEDGNKLYQSTLEVIASPLKAAIGSPTFRPRSVGTLTVAVSAVGRIVNCSTQGLGGTGDMSGVLAAMCSSMNGTFDEATGKCNALPGGGGTAGNGGKPCGSLSSGTMRQTGPCGGKGRYFGLVYCNNGTLTTIKPCQN